MAGLIDTQTTVAMLGLTNFVAGWPLLVVAHTSGLEVFRWPTNNWQWLVLNGFVEYLFDASCAIAIYMTSPVTVAMVSPLTIPLAAIVDRVLYGGDGNSETSTNNTASMVLGTAIILAGIYLMERKSAWIEARKVEQRNV